MRFASGADSVVQYIYYQPIVHRWRETDFFPCSVTCGGGKPGGALLVATNTVWQINNYRIILFNMFQSFVPAVAVLFVGYQLTSAECFDLRSGRVVVDQYCHYYPENIKPKPKLQECNMEPCLAR